MITIQLAKVSIEKTIALSAEIRKDDWMSTVPGNYKNDRYTQKNMEKETIYIRTEINKS